MVRRGQKVSGFSLLEDAFSSALLLVVSRLDFSVGFAVCWRRRRMGRRAKICHAAVTLFRALEAERYPWKPGGKFHFDLISTAV